MDRSWPWRHQDCSQSSMAASCCNMAWIRIKKSLARSDLDLGQCVFMLSCCVPLFWDTHKFASLGDPWCMQLRNVVKPHVSVIAFQPHATWITKQQKKLEHCAKIGRWEFAQPHEFGVPLKSPHLSCLDRWKNVEIIFNMCHPGRFFLLSHNWTWSTNCQCCEKMSADWLWIVLALINATFVLKSSLLMKMPLKKCHCHGKVVWADFLEACTLIFWKLIGKKTWWCLAKVFELPFVVSLDCLTVDLQVQSSNKKWSSACLFFKCWLHVLSTSEHILLTDLSSLTKMFSLSAIWSF